MGNRLPRNIYLVEPTKDGRKYVAKKSYKGVQRISKKFATIKEAQEALKELDRLYSNASPDSAKMTFDEAISEYLASEKEKTRNSTYKQEIKLCEHISASLGPIVINKLTIAEYRKFRSDLLEKNFSAGYCNKICTHVKSIIKLVRSRYGVNTFIPDSFDSFKDQEIKEEIEFYTLDEFKQFYNSIDGTDPENYKWKALFLCLFCCGLRIGEANALQFSCLDFENKRITIKQSVNTKKKDSAGNYLIGPPKNNSSYRKLPMPEELYKWFVVMLNHYSKYEGYTSDWFVFGGLTPIPDTTIQNANKRFAEAAGVKHIRIHGYRHSCCSYLISQSQLNGTGISFVEVAKYLGHADIQKTLNTYSHCMPNALDKIKAEFDSNTISVYKLYTADLLDLAPSTNNCTETTQNRPKSAKKLTIS